ncbi:MAG: hypothetical protein ACJ8J7_10110 [Sulfurifustaceae bacterium]
MFQIIAGGATVAALGQADMLVDIAGYDGFRVLVSAMVGALLTAVCAAYFRYQCRYWQSASSSAANGVGPAELKCVARVARYQRLTRVMLVVSLIGIGVGLVVLLAALWLGEPLPQNDDDEYRTTFVMKI